MKRYLVGGAVRDVLLGMPVGDRDWVVVGADPDEMRAAGYIAVGRDFPVFLHPETREEHALARTERKTAPGYRGFAFHADRSVTLEDDLLRRSGALARVLPEVDRLFGVPQRADHHPEVDTGVVPLPRSWPRQA